MLLLTEVGFGLGKLHSVPAACTLHDTAIEMLHIVFLPSKVGFELGELHSMPAACTSHDTADKMSEV